MDFTIDRDELRQGLTKMQSIVEQRGTLPILANIRIEAGPEILTLAATDLEVGAISTHPAEVKAEGCITVVAKKLFEISRELEENEVSIRVEEGSRVSLKSGPAHFSLLSTSAEEYPSIPGAEGVTLVELEARWLAEMIDRTVFAASTDETRYNLNGVYMELTEDKRLRFVATDGHRLAMIDKAPTNEVAFLDKGIIVPRKGVAEIRKLCDDVDGSVELGIRDGFLLVRRPGLVLSSRLIDGEYPNYRQVLPAEFKIRLVITRERLVHALRRVSLLVQERSRGFRLVIEDGQLELFAQNPDLGDAQEKLPVDYEGARFETGFNARYFLDALGAMPSKEVLLEIVDELAPCQLRPTDDMDQLAVIMPMRM